MNFQQPWHVQPYIIYSRYYKIRMTTYSSYSTVVLNIILQSYRYYIYIKKKYLSNDPTQAKRHFCIIYSRKRGRKNYLFYNT